MRALQAIGMGLLVVAIRAGEPDLLPDPLGWLLVLHGVRRLPAGLAGRGWLLLLGGLALLVSVPLWLPATATAILRADPALQWAVNLPQLGFLLLLARVLAARAGEHGDRPAKGWWGLVSTTVAVAAVLPVVVFGGGVTELESPALVMATLVLLTVIVLCFSHSGRTWLHDAGVEPGTPQGRPST